MVIDRRKFLRQASSIALINCLPVQAFASNANAVSEHIIGTCRLDESNYAVSSIDLSGRLNWQLELPARGHDVACHQAKPVGVVIARRPGDYILLFNANNGEKLHELIVDPHLKLNGHASWIGDRLIVSGSDRTSSQMCLLSYQLINNKLSLESIHFYDYFGPHEIRCAGNSMWVAVGGLITDDREVTNKTTLESLLLELDAHSLTVKNQYPAPFKSLSLRHLAISDAGQVFIAGQYQLESKNSPPLLFLLYNGSLQPFPNESNLWPLLKGYIGSILCVGDTVIASSPRSHWLGWFNAQSLEQEGHFLISDVCALAKTQQGFIAGSGTGRLYDQQNIIASKVKWDNHFTNYLPKT